MLYEDDLNQSFDFTNDVDEVKPKKSNGRKGSGPGAADKRATHNAIERARRESLNGRFMTLAEALPSMANVKRPSKSIIVNKALDFVYEAQVKEHALIKENNDLRRQVDQLRARVGMPPLPPPAPLPGASCATKDKKSSPSSTKVPSPAPTSASDVSAAFQHQQDFTASPQSIMTDQQPLPSPVSSFASDPAPSPALSAPSFGGLPLPSLAPNLNAFGSSQQQQTLSPFQIGGYPSPSPLPGSASASASGGGAMNTAQGLLTQQHTLLLAAHIQQQQAAAHQHQQQQQIDFSQFVSAGMGVGGVNAFAWPTGLGHGPMWTATTATGPYGGLESYPAFLA